MAGRDSFSEKYMGKEGEVLYRDKLVGRWPWHAALLSPVLLMALMVLLTALGTESVGDALTSTAVTVGPVAAVMLPIWLLFSVLRVTVTTRAVDLKFGLFGPEIPIDAIIDCEATTYDWKEFGGFGIRYSDGRWLYNMIGDKGQAVQIRWNDGGQTKTTLVASHDNVALAAAINEACVRSAGEVPKVRVADEGVEHEEEVEAASTARSHRRS